MPRAEEKRFYAKTLGMAWLLLAAAYAFMAFHFIWGNHDWGYLKSGVSLSAGVFEARFSQHLPSVLLFGGQVLPVFGMLCGLLMAAATGMAAGVYFGVPPVQRHYLVLALFAGLNPHIFVIFYYVYLILPFTVWGILAVALLFCAEPSYRWYKFAAGAAGYFLLWSGYAPVLALSGVLFCGKRVLACAYGGQPLRQSIANGAFFAAQAGAGALGFKALYFYFSIQGMVATNMYNLQLRTPLEMAAGIWRGIGTGATQLWHYYPFLEGGYCWPLALGTLTAGTAAALGAKGRRGAALLWLAMMSAASRLVFIVASQADIAAFRAEYWGRLGIYLFMFGVLLRAKSQWAKNIAFAGTVAILLGFVGTGLEIQKVWALGFDGTRRYQARVAERIVQLPGFKPEGPYIAFAFGQPDFRRKFHHMGRKTGELAGGELTFPFDTIPQLFWEDAFSPIAFSAGILGRQLFMDKRGENAIDAPFYKNNPEHISNIRWWLYTEAAVYPNEKAFYIDDKYILAVLDKESFYKDRETVTQWLDK